VSFNGKTGFTEIGTDQINDFSKSDINTKNLGYLDLKQAYSKNGIINARNVNARESYRNIEEYERARASTISYQMTPEEMQREEMRKRREAEEEEKRLHRIQQKDSSAFNSYNRVHQMMIDKLK
jgi:hypothetical protein